MCAISVNDFGVGGSTCPGDSGSPLVALDEQNGGWTIIGVLSNGARSCFRGMPEVYTEVTTYLEWIRRTMEKHDIYDIQNEDSYLFYPYFSSQQHHSSHTNTLPQIVRSPRNIFSLLYNIFEK